MELLSKFKQDEFIVELERQGLKKSSIEQYVYAVKSWLKYMEKFDNLNEEEFIDKIYDFLSSKKRQWFLRFGIKLYIEFIGKKDLYDKFYMKYRRKMKMLSRKNPKKSLSPNQIVLVGEHIKIPFKLMFFIQYETALRFSDVAKIKFGDFSRDEEGMVWLSLKEKKTEKIRSYLLSDKLSWILAKYIKINNIGKDDRIFKCRLETYNYNIKIACKEAGIDNYSSISSHWIRTSRAVHLARKGYDIHTIKRLLNHSSIKNTEVYLQEAGIDLKELLRKETVRWSSL